MRWSVRVTWWIPKGSKGSKYWRVWGVNLPKPGAEVRLEFFMYRAADRWHKIGLTGITSRGICHTLKHILAGGDFSTDSLSLARRTGSGNVTGSAQMTDLKQTEATIVTVFGMSGVVNLCFIHCHSHEPYLQCPFLFFIWWRSATLCAPSSA